ncbi:MAG TPA: M28 family peptidase [Candidatus Latescibacteria bacterium]|nr:M28 family peptidase [Candidatus Latescibacterota bacterium]
MWTVSLVLSAWITGYALELGTVPQAPRPEVTALLDSVDVSRMERLLRPLVYRDTTLPYDNSLANLRNRYALNPATFDTLHGVPAYLRRLLREALPEAQVRFLPFRHKEGPVLYNISAILPGEGLGRFLLTAHYDAIVREDPDSALLRTFGSNWADALKDTLNPVPTPGADDNGSGIMAVIEAARWLSRLRLPWSVEVVLFCGEELGLWGSEEYVRTAARREDTILGVINVDMIAGNRFYKLDIVANPSSEPLLALFADANRIYGIGLDLRCVVDPAVTYGDHASFWRRGYRAVLLIEHYNPWRDDPQGYYRRNRAFHTVYDVMDSLNLRLWRKETQLLVAALGQFALPQPDAVPDLVVWSRGVRLNPSGDTLWVSVQNLSNSPSGRTALELWRCGPDSACFEEIWRWVIPSVAPWGTYTSAAPWPYWGEALVSVKVDPDDFVAEVHEDNNRAYARLLRKGEALRLVEAFPYPNPSEGPVHFLYNLTRPGRVWLEVFTGMGEKIWEATEDQRRVGRKELLWPARVPPGLYLFRLSAYDKGASSPSDVRWGKVAVVR